MPTSLKLILILLTLLFTSCQTQSSEIKPNLNSKQNAPTSTPTSSKPELPPEISNLGQKYQRLTIPYLRTQSFPGSEITIRDTHQQTSTHTNYLTSYQSEDLTINALLTKPTSTPPPEGFPAVVFVHGYIPPNSYRTTSKYESFVNYLAQQDIVVFKIDLRGHGTSDGQPSGAYFSSDYIYDILNAYHSLKTLEYVNSNNISLWGHSMAGNIVLRSAAVQTDIPKIVIFAGAVYTYQDFQEYRIQDSSYDPSQNPNRGKRQELYDTVGEVTPENKFWQSVAPTNFLSDLSTTIHLHHAQNDSVVDLRYSTNLAQILSEKNISHQLFTYPTGGHNLTGSTFTSAMNQTAQLIKQ